MKFLLTNKTYLFLNVIIAAFTGAALWSCDNEQISRCVEEEATLVRFTSGSILTMTRSSWVGDERVGVYMIRTGESLDATTIVDEADNREYVANDRGESSTFDPVIHEEAIYYPMSGSVDFIAYCPYKKNGTGTDEINDCIYPVNVSDQSDPSRIDFLYATATNQDKTNLAVALQFDHQLSKVVFKIRKGAGHATTDFSGLQASVRNVPLSADYQLADLSYSVGNFGEITSRLVEAGTTYEAIVIPQSEGTDRKFVFSLEGEEYIWEVPDELSFEAGSENVFTATVSRANVTVEAETIQKWTVSSDPTTGVAD